MISYQQRFVKIFGKQITEKQITGYRKKLSLFAPGRTAEKSFGLFKKHS